MITEKFLDSSRSILQRSMSNKRVIEAIWDDERESSDGSAYVWVSDKAEGNEW